MTFASTKTMHVGSIIQAAAVSLAVLLGGTPSFAQSVVGTTFNCSRDNMKKTGVLLNGVYDVQFQLFDAATGGTQVGPTSTKTGITITAGKLPPQLVNFGKWAFDGDARWLAVSARQGANAYAATGPRERLRPVPYALALPGLYTLQNDISPNIVGGYAGNIIDGEAVGAVIAGGGEFNAVNTVSNDFGAIGGGVRNIAGDGYATVAGGTTNTAGGYASAVVGGYSNLASGGHTVVAGGYNNTASGNAAAVGGGSTNLASGVAATVAGGRNNTASGNFSAIAGGDANTASGGYSFAGGRRAFANYPGSFIWGDSVDANKFAFGDNSFTVHASGGSYFYSNVGSTSGVFLSPGGGSWSAVSDRNLKQNFQSVNAQEVLERLSSMPVTMWSYIAQDPSIRHIGPMAQDFSAAFAVGEDDRHITQTDADGVLFAAVQALHHLQIDADSKLDAMRESIDEMSSSLEQRDELIVSQRQVIENLLERLNASRAASN